ncbi:hypothetical protein B0F90DRAFT_1811443 [Multifurca ochricompacta]|uniref:Uncharacterized protein n=1 Tax=Multifurca ochricompacta TaxID=376703 RepID=A0AAD4M125_9AGAM|nr:hypothetical protein B0F90DRAFT_1811443 [Multifurca ochricompacta]
MAAAVSPTTPIDLPLERSLYVGNFFRAILYGIEVCTFFAAVYCISGRSSSYQRGRKIYVTYGAVLLSLVTIAVVTDALWGQFMWIDHRNYPGGPLGYFSATENAWYNVFGSAADATANILGDGLLVYRCYMIWGSRWYIIILPVLIYLASSVLVIITIVESSLPNSFLLNGKPANFGVPWVALSVSLNSSMRALTREVLSPEMSKTYTSVTAMLIESAAPFSILGIGLVVTEAQNGPLAIAFSYTWGIFCSLSPQMIILRVAMGHGWLKETVDQISTAPAFAEPLHFERKIMEGGGGENATLKVRLSRGAIVRKKRVLGVEEEK